MSFLKPFLVSSFALVALSACGPGDTLSSYNGGPGLNIVGAQKADLSQDMLARAVPHLDFFDSAVPKADSLCTGTLIGDQIILTAAHCVEGAEFKAMKPVPLTIMNQPEQVLLDFGQKNFPVLAVSVPAAPDMEVLAVEAVLHPNFLEIGNTLDSDIALVRLAKPVKSSLPLPKIKLDTQDIGHEIGTKVFAYGYGYTSVVRDEEGKLQYSGSGELKRKDFLVMKMTYLSQYLDSSDSFMIENLNHKADGSLCKGDSGGPLFAQTSAGPVLVGVISKAEGLCADTAILKSVSYYRDWIQATAAAWKLQLY